MIDIWQRLEQQESDRKPRIWEHKETGEKVKIKKFDNGTWDTFREDTLIENYDTAEEAIERGTELVGKS